MRTKPSIIKTLWVLGMAAGMLLILEACAARRNLIADGTYALAVDPELLSVVDDVTATRMDETLTVTGRIASGAGSQSGRIRIDLIDPQGRQIDSRTAVYYPKHCHLHYCSLRSVRHQRYHRLGRFSITFRTLPPAGTTIHLRKAH